MEIFERINALITDNETRLNELAKRIGCSEKQITRWRHNEAEMGIYKLKAFCEYYHVSADYILDLPKDSTWPR